MITFTLGNALAFVVALMGLTFLVHGLQWAYIDEVIVGALLFVGAWYITTVGPLL